jgi:peptidoglycan/LPS O-acetylase OafA/YrhL
MTSSVLNPWRLEYFFKTYGYTAVYSSNIGLDEFFFISGLLTTIKLMAYLKENDGKMPFLSYLKIFITRFLRLALVMYAVFLIGW